jgi:hypothetical protein
MVPNEIDSKKIFREITMVDIFLKCDHTTFFGPIVDFRDAQIAE